MKWKRTRVPDNKGKALDVWISGPYEISENINHGDAWYWEVLCSKKAVGEGRTLEAAKRIALEHYVNRDED